MLSMNLVDNLHGCYLLHCNNPKKGYRGRTYIGYTVDPVQRIGQHNNGIKRGGAYATNAKAPWDMTLFVSGFPCNIAALRFENAWQKPYRSRRLKHLPRKRLRETQYAYRLRILAEMLNTKPWSRLPLRVNWLCEKYKEPLVPPPPPHVIVVSGFIGAHKTQKNAKLITPIDDSEEFVTSNPVIDESDDSFSDHSGFMSLAAKMKRGCRQQTEKKKIDSSLSGACEFCGIVGIEKLINCARKSCPSTFHLTCLATHLAGDELIPLEFKCATCSVKMAWGSFIRTYVKGEHLYECDRPMINPFIGENRVEDIEKARSSKK